MIKKRFTKPLYGEKRKKSQLLWLTFFLMILGSISPLQRSYSQSVAAKRVDSQQVLVSGTVRDAITGESIVGASIKVEGTHEGTITNIDGKFTLKVSTANVNLLISYIGYVPQTVALKGKSKVDVLLSEQTRNLEEVVVVGYGKQKKASVTGAIGQMNSKELLISPVSNITNSLMGKVAGVTSIAQNGQPGKQAADIFVRGKATWGDASAIVVIDGVERADFGNIDPNEIESISILKDASSTAIFGVRGANGVIVVTTKTGRESKPKVSYTGNVTMNYFTNLPKILDSYNSAVLKNEGMAYDGKAPMFSDAELQKFKDGSDPIGYPNVDWINTVMRSHNIQTQHNVSVSGGTQFVKYYLSAGYLFEDGIFKNLPSPYGIKSTNDYNRYNFRSNLDFNLSKDLQIGVKLGARKERIYEPSYKNGTTINTMGRMMYQIQLTPSFAYPTTLPDGRIANIRGAGPNDFNPIALLTRSGYQITQKNNIQSTLNLNYKMNWLTQGLSFMSLFTFDNDMNSVATQHSSFASYNIDRATKVVTLDATFQKDDPLGLLTPTPNANQGGMNYNINTGFDYNRDFGKHNFSGLWRLTRKLTQALNQADAPYAVQGTVGRVTYNYNGTYLAEVSAAYNGSENFPAGKRYGFFPAFSAGWVVSNEPFFKQSLSSVINFFKIRGSWGTAGNDRIGGSRFLYLDDYAQRTGTSGTVYGQSSINNRVLFGNPTGASSYPIVYHSRLGNPDVTWEKSLKRNIAFESSFLGGNLLLNADFYDENRTDILLPRQSGLSTYGDTYPTVNYGASYNSGYEIEVKYKQKIGDVTLGLNSQISHAKNKIISKDEPQGMPDYQKLAGKPIDQLFGYKTAGFYNSQADIDNWPVNKLGVVHPGDLKFVDINGDNVIDANDKCPIMTPTLPEYTYSFEPTIEWNGFSLSAMFQGTSNSTANFIMTFNWFEFMNERWTAERYANGDKISWPAVPSSYSSVSINNPNDFILSDNSYLKLRNAQFSWQVPDKMTSKLKISGLRIFLSGENLYTWTKFKYYVDPEITIGAGDYRKEYAYPSARKYNLGINIQF